MKLRQMLRGFCVFALVLFCGHVIEGQVPAQGPPSWIESVAEPGQGLAIKDVSAQTGFVTFATSPGNGILLPVAAGASAEERALSFVQAYGKAFGLADSSQVRLLRAEHKDELGLEHVRFQQVHQGVPIRGGEFLVHLKGARAIAANGHMIGDLPANVIPRLAAEQARSTARQVIEKYRRNDASGASYSEPRLEILNRSLLSGQGNDRSRLAWFIEATGPALRQYIWIDAQSGVLLLQFSQLTDAKNRTIYTSANTSTLPGTLLRSEGGLVTGDADADNAYLYAGITYDYYLTNHGRDSFDGFGAEIRSTVHYCSVAVCPGDYANAFWNGTQMVYGNGYASADDVVAHEITHAVTERTAGLLYYVQSGALSESFSDIFGETVDQGSAVGGGNDQPTAKWQMGEDIGAIRNMMNPNLFSDPARMNDPLGYFKCSTSAWTDDTSDHGGVHSNSGIPNHAFALMVDGGTYNGKTVTAIGFTKAAKIQYRALSTYLTSGSGFLDDYNALNQSCNELIGTAGITSADCTQVRNALDAVEMNALWACAGRYQPPAMCPTGQPSYTSIEGFESGFGNWTPTNALGTWDRIGDWAKTGVVSMYGTDPNGTSDHKITMINAVTVPTAGRLYFDHAFEFENDLTAAYDGGVIEYSTDGGTAWIDAGSLRDAGHPYDGVLDPGNALGVRNAFVGSSYEFTATRLNLVSLAGQSVKFRFRIGSDPSVSSLGWAVDEIKIYNCGASQAFTDDPLVVGVTPVKLVHIAELRGRINPLRVARGIGASAFTDPSLIAGSTRIKAVHITELRTALAGVYTAAGRALPGYTDPSLAAGASVKAVHIRELRNALLGIE